MSRETVNSAAINFRLQDEESWRVLSARAEALGVSPHQLARRYVIEVLQEAQERAALRAAVVELRQQVIGLREDIALATEALLARAGKVTDEKARAWVEENFT